jgi:hypothetical protein
VTDTAMPPRTGTGINAYVDRPWRPTTVQPLAMPSAPPATTSLSQWRLSCSRDAAT